MSGTKGKTKLGYGFRGKDKTLYMVRCFSCAMENWAPAVASGKCAWCGYEMKEGDADERG